MEWVIFLVIALLVVPIGYAAYRKYRYESQEAWRRMPPGENGDWEMDDGTDAPPP
jgi:hypothetical protein